MAKERGQNPRTLRSPQHTNMGVAVQESTRDSSSPLYFVSDNDLCQMFRGEFGTGQACGKTATEQSPLLQFMASTIGSISV